MFHKRGPAATKHRLTKLLFERRTTHVAVPELARADVGGKLTDVCQTHKDQDGISKSRLFTV